jgi:hypothetical protein
MSNSPAFREALALAASALATHCNVHTADPGTTGTSEASSARGAITWTGGAVDGTVTGAEVTLASVPAGTYTYVSLFGGLTGSNYQTSYLLPLAVTLGSTGPVKVTPQIVIPA